jgi:hypothetical protein
LRGSLRPLPFDNKEGLLKSRFWLNYDYIKSHN